MKKRDFEGLWKKAGILVLLAALTALPSWADDDERLVISAFTDKSLYAPGETIELSVRAYDADGSAVTRLKEAEIKIKDSAGRRLLEDDLFAMGDGEYLYRYVIGPNDAPGTWRLILNLKGSDGEEGRNVTRINVAAGTAPSTDPGEEPPVVPGPTEPPAEPPSTDPPVVIDPPVVPEPPVSGVHGSLTWQGPGTCLSCHETQARDAHASLHYQWLGDTPYMTSGDQLQGKLTNSVNSYCINIEGNWTGCGKCHAGLGARPEAAQTRQQLENVDCLICHQEQYRRTLVDGIYQPDEASMGISATSAVRTVHRTTRTTCLQCHAKAGGGDAVKRGDLALAHSNTSDRNFDVHMATTGANLECGACHTTQNHRIAGKGSDLRPTDLDVKVDCVNCHAGMASANGHSSAVIGRHVARVACQTCHIPEYAKNAGDTSADEATETHRTWLETHSTQAPFHPASTKANDLTPKYRFWNGFSKNYTRGEIAEIDPVTGNVPTSRPLGSVDDPESKLFPFKYKTAEQPITQRSRELVLLDTSVFFATGDPVAATRQGLVNMGLGADEPYEWTLTDTYQLLAHEVSPSTQSLQCADCHGSTARMDLKGELGYALKAPASTLCVSCHSRKENLSFSRVHDKHVRDKGYDCSRCHTFSRPERGLRR